MGLLGKIRKKAKLNCSGSTSTSNSPTTTLNVDTTSNTDVEKGANNNNNNTNTNTNSITSPNTTPTNTNSNRKSILNVLRPNSPLGANSPTPVQQALQQRKQFATEGNLNFRLLAFVGGATVIITSIESLSLCFYNGEFLKVFIYLYTLCFGFIICLLEGQFLVRRFESIQMIRYVIVESIPVLKYLWGRGVFYMISGILQLSELSPANIISGLFLIGVGVLFVMIGWHTKKRLKKLKTCFTDPRNIKKYFRKYDRDGDNVLDRDEFGDFIIGMTNEAMDEDELEGAFAVLDTKGKGYVTLEEFTAWFVGYDASVKAEDTGGYDLM